MRLISAPRTGGAIREGRFREDLYFRLAGVTLYIPPLPAPRGYSLLVEQFWKKLQMKYGRHGPEMNRETISALASALARMSGNCAIPLSACCSGREGGIPPRNQRALSPEGARSKF